MYNINEIPRQTGLPPVPREALREIVERESLALLGIKNKGKTEKMEQAKAKQETEKIVAE